MARRLARLLNATSEPLQFSRDELVPMSKTESSLAPKLIDRLSPPTRLCGSPRSLRRGPRSRTRGLRQEFARLAWPLARPTEIIPRSPSQRRHDAARQTGSGACACIWPVALEKTECTRPRRRVPHARSGAATRHTRAARALRAALCPPPTTRAPRRRCRSTRRSMCGTHRGWSSRLWWWVGADPGGSTNLRGGE